MICCLQSPAPGEDCQREQISEREKHAQMIRFVDALSGKDRICARVSANARDACIYARWHSASALALADLFGIHHPVLLSLCADAQLDDDTFAQALWLHDAR